MKIIKKGKLRLATCSYCESVLQYDINKDIKSKDIEVFDINCHKRIYKYITCPVCNQEIDITNEVEL